jgi:hypothetical protein
VSVDLECEHFDVSGERVAKSHLELFVAEEARA